MPRSPRSQKSCTRVRKSAHTVGVGSAMLSNTRIRPAFSATKTRPSGAQRIDVGFVKPDLTTESVTEGGSAAAASCWVAVPRLFVAKTLLVRAWAGSVRSRNAMAVANATRARGEDPVDIARPYGRSGDAPTGRWNR